MAALLNSANESLLYSKWYYTTMFKALFNSSHKKSTASRKLVTGKPSSEQKWGCQVKRANGGTIYNGKIKFCEHHKSEHFLNLHEVSEQQSFLLCYLQSCMVLNLTVESLCMQIELRAEQNPLDLTCLQVSSCWLCCLSECFQVSPSSCGCFTDPNPCLS